MGKVLLGYSIIPTAIAHDIPIEDISPPGEHKKLHMFCIGIRDVDVQGDVPQRCHISFDFFGVNKHPE